MRSAYHQSSQILLVERNLAFARLIRSELAHRGFRSIRMAGDTEEALSMMAIEKFDAVLCDSETGPLRGPAFISAARLRDDMIDVYVPIIMTSFIPTWRAISICRDAGANTFLAKPVSNTQLTEKLGTVLTEQRRFVRARGYFGPDRRKGERPAYHGAERRSSSPREWQAVPVPKLVA